MTYICCLCGEEGDDVDIREEVRWNQPEGLEVYACDACYARRDFWIQVDNLRSERMADRAD